MTSGERRAGLGLASIFALRMLGLFLILPVFSVYAQHLPSGGDMALVGLALGAYGLTQTFLQIAYGAASDRFGRKTALIAASVLFIVLTVPLFSMLDGASFAMIVLIQVIFGALLTVNDGTLPCFLTEIFPTRVRYSGFAFSFNTANALFGGTAPFVATWLIAATGSKTAPAWYLVAAAVVALVAMLASRETAHEDLADD